MLYYKIRENRQSNGVYTLIRSLTNSFILWIFCISSIIWLQLKNKSRHKNSPIKDEIIF